MDLLAQLASQVGTRGEAANIRVAEKCLRQPSALSEIVNALDDQNARLVGDCAEVLAKVAEKSPELVAPHASTLFALLSHKNGRVRWESAQALGLVARLVPKFIAGKLYQLEQLSLTDESVIVRDNLLDAVAGYASTGKGAATKGFPILANGAMAWNGKHAARVLSRLDAVAVVEPSLRDPIRELASRFVEHARPGVRKAAKAVLKRVPPAG